MSLRGGGLSELVGEGPRAGSGRGRVVVAPFEVEGDVMPDSAADDLGVRPPAGVAVDMGKGGVLCSRAASEGARPAHVLPQLLLKDLVARLRLGVAVARRRRGHRLQGRLVMGTKRFGGATKSRSWGKGFALPGRSGSMAAGARSRVFLRALWGRLVPTGGGGEERSRAPRRAASGTGRGGWPR